MSGGGGVCGVQRCILLDKKRKNAGNFNEPARYCIFQNILVCWEKQQHEYQIISLDFWSALLPKPPLLSYLPYFKNCIY